MDMCFNNSQTELTLFNSGTLLLLGPARCSFCKRGGPKQKWWWDKYQWIRPIHFSSNSSDNKKGVHGARATVVASTGHENEIYLAVQNFSLSDSCFTKSNDSIMNDSSVIWLLVLELFITWNRSYHHRQNRITLNHFLTKCVTNQQLRQKVVAMWNSKLTCSET